MKARIMSVHPLPGVRAGSALLRVGTRLLAVQDDAYCAYWIDLPGLLITQFVLKADGAQLPKARKPDFEAAVRTVDGRVYFLGSGSAPQRTVLARIDLERTSVVLTDLPQIYQCVRDTLGLATAPNIEGATVDGHVLRLFHRGAGPTPSASIDLPLDVLDGAPPRALAWHWLRLEQIDGIQLSITDAAILAPRRTLFLAVAEDTNNAIDDGPVAGCAVGVIAGPPDRPVVRVARLVEADGRPSRRKVEGVAVDDGLRGAWVITDPDDPDQAAELCRIELRGLLANDHLQAGS